MLFPIGYSQYYKKLIENITKNPSLVVKKLKNEKDFWAVGDNKNMKIDAIIGNPPYQVMDGGAGASSTPIYNNFIEISKVINPLYISLIIPARWYSGGKGLHTFRKNMLEDNRIKYLYDYINTQFLFQNVDIKGGICYFLWSNEWNTKCHVITHTADLEKPLKSYRFLKEQEDYIFIRDPRLLSIKSAITKGISIYQEKTFDTMVSTMKPYGLRGDFFKDPAKYDLPPVSKKHIKDEITIIGLGENLKRTFRYVPKTYPLPQVEGLDTYKIFVPRNWGTGKLQDNIYKTYPALPYEICTETFIQVYPFTSKEERDNCDKYMQTKFFRIAVSIKKQDQGAGKGVYSYVPIQNFTRNSDIDWSLSIDEIDKELYKKYHLSADDILFIEKNIKPIE